MTVLRTFRGRTDFMLCLAVWCVGAIMFAPLHIGAGRASIILMNLWLLPLAVLLALSSLRLLDMIEKKRVILKLALTIIGILLSALALLLIDYLTLIIGASTIFPHWRWAPFGLAPDWSSATATFLIYVLGFALCAALTWANRAGEIAALNEARAIRAEAETLRAEATALRLQLNPHFLFNTLNGIASLVVRRKAAAAEEMIGRLADFLRASLAADPNAPVSLRQELLTVKSYLEIEKARLGTRVRVIDAIDDSMLGASVPNFILQPLVENAVKHGVVAGGIEITISARKEGDTLLLSVENKACSRAAGGAVSTRREDPIQDGIGLANTRRRLKSLYGERARLKAAPAGDGFRCEIGLPYAMWGEAE